MDRLDSSQAKDYWQNDGARVGKIESASDPDALGNVCHVGAPAWFNAYYARYQRRVFEEILGQCPTTPGARALDIGCGAGRWCRLLAGRGYAVHGIDLQQSLIDRNRRRHPEMAFDCVAIQDFQPKNLFDLATTVTVIQHIPFDEQPKAIAKIASIVRPGGHVLTLENINDQGAHVFANSIEGWTRAFAIHGFELVLIRRYDYSPAIRFSSMLVNATARWARRLGVMSTPAGPELPRAPTAAGMDEGGPIRRAVRSAGWAARHAAVSIDDLLEPPLIHMNLALPTVHCGFLFRKTS